ncbi:LOW QUALITY PROTEIN: eukaryotic translation initiation factor 5B-like [Asparagus officinalis]|uniref:LOW QUALITY PROTEIN: eukaryotic translation initiation factor 5B-like n=1 Tax=Asparagus officinalis TaxID=4686 RepID=UPI00098E2C9E|nr:LOW QUALITY PROTEIN: eukaryotic translation initiation factor 5B-like [Asparagus officinalis]
MGRKKPVAIDDDEYSFPEDPDQKPQAAAPAAACAECMRPPGMPRRTRKGATRRRKGTKTTISTTPLTISTRCTTLVLSGKKKSSKSKKNSISAFSALNALDEDDVDGDDRSEVVDDGNHVEEDGDKDEELEFDFGKKKKKSKKKTGGGKFALTADEEDEEEEKSEITNDNSVDDEKDEESKDLDFDFGKKKKSKKKKNGKAAAQEADDLDKLLAELGEGAPAVEEAPPPAAVKPKEVESKETELDSKNKKKKKKKTGRTAEEEDDLDKILAELGEGGPPSSSVPPPVAELQVAQPEPVEAEEKEVEVADAVESAAAKKKKKKKEKEKEKKAAAKKEEAEVKEEAPVKGKAADNKKLPKHVREMQEALARRKEEEERRKREEEEKLRKEEEERLRREEEERLAEEAKRRKKEREKEKLLKKKQEGKLLTGKQKEEQRRLEAMRRQFLGQNEVPVGDALVEVKKRPKYETRKSKAKVVEAEKPKESQQEVAEPEVDRAAEDFMTEESQSQADEVEEIEAKQEEKEEVEAVEEDEDEDEWDAKSWDDVDVTLPATSPFAEEDKEEEDAQPVVKKGAPAPVERTKNTVASRQPAKKGDVENNANEHGEVKMKNEVAKKKEVKTSEDTSEKSSENELRSPICCILGHVDTGKTKLLDCIRRTNVQEGEAGGITQQIGATYFPTENIRERTKELKADATLKVPGLLVIDTPGHESFTNLRSRGSSLCDIAVLVVDIMHGLDPQTIESLNMLKSRNTEFIVALNKVDRLYGWKTCPNAPIIKAMKQQSNDVKNEFNMRLTQIVTQFKEQGLNTALYYKNREMGETFNIVPTSAISGEGIPDLLLLLIQWTQKTMEEKLTYSDEVECTVLEVKMIEGLGTTIDVVLVNGVLHEGDQIVVCGMQGPIMATIRALLTPHPMKELRVKGTYLHHKEIKAAQGVKISAQGLDHAIAGTALYVVGPDDDLEVVKEAVMQDMHKVMSRIDKSGEGVYVQASTLGSLEALTEFLKSPAVSIPFCDFSIGPVHKKDVMKASVMRERGKKEYATILAFDVKIDEDARILAKELQVEIFEADIIYHLFDQFKAYIDNVRAEKKKESAEDAVFPCVLKIMPNCVFNKKDPIVLGVDVSEGILKVGTPICIPSQEFIDIGKIASIEMNHKPVETATKGQKVAIKIVGSNPEEQQKMFGRHFDMGDELVSHITRRSIDVLKADYRDDLSIEEWKLVVKLKQIFKIL